MALSPQNQASQLSITGTVDEAVLTKDYWHGRFKAVIKRFDSFNHMIDEMAEADPEHYAKADGFTLLHDVRSKRAKVIVMAKAVLLMEKLRPAPPAPNAPTSTLRRQKIKID